MDTDDKTDGSGLCVCTDCRAEFHLLAALG